MRPSLIPARAFFGKGRLQPMKYSSAIKTVSVVGSGAWGTSIAQVIAENNPGADTVMWAYERSVASSINRSHENAEYLPGVPLAPSIRATTNIRDAVRGAEVIIVSTPSKAVYETCQKMARYLRPDAIIGFLSKGFCKIDNQVLTISQTIARALPSHKNRVIAVSGPSHAEEVSRRYHTCLNVAGADHSARRTVAELLSCDYIQCRELDDIIGVEIGGTLKNPAAIAAGMISVLPGCGDNLAGALMSEALKEMLRLGAVFKSKPETILDISGLGDLVATALSEHSRNRRFGKDIARQILTREPGLSLADKIILKFKPDLVIHRLSKGLHYLAEGAYAIEPLIDLAVRHNIPIPVYRSLYEVLLNKKNPTLLIETIKNPQKFEELYRNTKIHVSSRKKGLETVRGAVFRAKIEARIDSSFREAGPEIRSAEMMHDLVSAAEAAGYRFTSREHTVIKDMSAGGASAALMKLSRIYLDDIIDNYNSVFRWFYVNSQKMHFSFHPLVKGKVHLSVAGDTVKIQTLHRSSNIIYLPRFKSSFDFIPSILAISKSGLPFPRFYVPENTVRNVRDRYLVKKAGGFIVDENRFFNQIYKQTLHHYMATLLEHGVPVMVCSGSSPGRNFVMSAAEFTAVIRDVMYNHTVDIMIVPMEFSETGKGDRSGDGLKNISTGDQMVRFLEPITLSDYTDTTAPEKNLQGIIEQVWA